MLKYYKIAFQICRAKIPSDFAGELRWILSSNQMFYRAVHGYILALIRLNQLNNAIVLCEWLKALDPGDYVGIGRLLVDLYLKMGKYEKLIQYFEVYTVANLDYYSLAFAYFQLREFEKSARCLIKGIRYNPYLCQFLAGNSVSSDVVPAKILAQSSYPEALAYYQENHIVWEQAKELLGFILRMIEIPSIAAYLSQMNQNAAKRIKPRKQKNTESPQAVESLNDEMIEQLLESSDFQRIACSISVTDFKLV